MADVRTIRISDDGLGWQEVVSPDTLVLDALRVATTLVVPSGASFPGSPVANEIFWRTDTGVLWRRNAGNTAWEPVSGNPALGAAAYYPHGFVNQTDSTVSWNDGSLQLTITPTGTSFVFFYQGTQYSKTVAESITIANSTGLHFIYYNSSGALAESTTPWTLQT